MPLDIAVDLPTLQERWFDVVGMGVLQDEDLDDFRVAVGALVNHDEDDLAGYSDVQDLAMAAIDAVAALVADQATWDVTDWAANPLADEYRLGTRRLLATFASIAYVLIRTGAIGQ